MVTLAVHPVPSQRKKVVQGRREGLIKEEDMFQVHSLIPLGLRQLVSCSLECAFDCALMLLRRFELLRSWKHENDHVL